MSINLDTIRLKSVKAGTVVGNTTQSKDNIIDVGALIEGYNNIFAEGESYSTEIKEKLKDIVGTDAINAPNFYTTAKKINGTFIDSNCLEGYRAYSFYLEKIVALLNQIDNAVEQGKNAIDKIEEIQNKDEYVNDKVHALSSQLYLADKAIADAMDEFKSCLKYNADTKSWDTSSYDYDSNQVGSPASLEKLRELRVEITDAGKDEDKDNATHTHEITCFSELNLLDRLRYIRRYYELILSSGDTKYQVFPDDSETGYPCIPDVESTTDTKATESMGGFELFYVGYLVDRDGSIDAYSSCLEAKSTAITNNISLQSKHIEAYNQYLTFINRASQLLNKSQSGGTAAISHGAHLGLTYFCGGTMRDLLEVDGVDYIVLPYTDKNGSVDTDRYLLVRADEYGLEALYNTEDIVDPNGGVGGVKRLEMITAGDLEVLFTQKHTEKDKDGKEDIITNYENKVTYDCELKNVSGFDGTTFYKRAHCATYSSTCPIIVSSSDKNEILIWKCSADKAEKYLPKRLTAQTIAPNSVAQYDNYQSVSAWGDDADAKNRVINSWTSAFSNKSEYINTAIESINTDITALRTKMDTIDSLCSTLRNRSFETKKQLVSNIRS